MIKQLKKLEDFYKKYYKKFLFLIIMTITRKEIITEKYNLLKTELNKYISENLFPSLDDYDLSNIIYYLNYYFPKGSEEYYSDTIERLMKSKNIELDDNDYSDVVNLIIDFINFLNNL
jgi:hypothetical protein